MIVLFRSLVLLLALAFLACMGLHRLTGHPVWRQRAMALLRWGVVLALGFFGVLILRRAAVFI